MEGNPSQKPVLMVGNSLENKGGMTTVVKLYRQSGFMDRTTYLETMQEGSSKQKITMFLSFLIRLSQSILLNPSIKIVHMHVSQRGSFVRKGIALLICKAFRKKVIWHMHGSEFSRVYQALNPFFQAITRWTLNKVDCHIALSEQRKQELAAITPKATIEVVYNPCLIPTKQEHRIRNTQGKVHFLFMGRYGKRKGVYDIIEAVRLLNDKRVLVSMYGDVEVESVKLNVRTAELTEQIQVNSWISGEEKQRIFLASDVLLLPSYNEGLPMAVLEAMGYAMPVISTPIGGIPEAVLDGKNGFLITPGDTAALAARMDYFVRNPTAIQNMGQQGYQLACDQFELNKIMKRLAGIYRTMDVDLHYNPKEHQSALVSNRDPFSL